MKKNNISEWYLRFREKLIVGNFNLPPELTCN